MSNYNFYAKKLDTAFHEAAKLYKEEVAKLNAAQEARDKAFAWSPSTQDGIAATLKEAKQQAADHRVGTGPHDLRLHAQLHVAEDTDSADRHAEDNGFCHMGAPGNPQVAKCRGETDLRPFNQQTESHAEQHG